MQLYLNIAWRSFRRAATYRSAYIAGILTNAFFGALVCYVYQAVYAGGGIVAGLTVHDAISYSWATQSLISVGGAWIISTGLSESIRSGDVVTDLTRPWNFFLYWLSRTVGERFYNLLIRGAITYLLGVLYFGARIPNWFDLVAFVPAITLAILLSFALSYCVSLTAFWLIDNSGLHLLINVLLTFFSGFVLPLAYFPPTLQALARVLPFQAITSLPARIFLGQIEPIAVGAALLLQLFWVLVMIGLGLAMQAAAMRKVVIQGG